MVDVEMEQKQKVQKGSEILPFSHEDILKKPHRMFCVSLASPIIESLHILHEMIVDEETGKPIHISHLVEDLLYNTLGNPKNLGEFLDRFYPIIDDDLVTLDEDEGETGE